MLGPISGAQFNPAVTLVATARREMHVGEGALYIGVQIAGGLSGAVLANVMFALVADTSAHCWCQHGLVRRISSLLRHRSQTQR